MTHVAVFTANLGLDQKDPSIGTVLGVAVFDCSVNKGVEGSRNDSVDTDTGSNFATVLVCSTGNIPQDVNKIKERAKTNLEEILDVITSLDYQAAQRL